MKDPTVKMTMEANVNTMLDALESAAQSHSKSLKLSRDQFEKGAINDLNEIWSTSEMTCPSSMLACRCLKTTTGWQVRGIPMDFVEADPNEKRQEISIDFLPDGKIANVSVAMELHRYDEIMAQADDDDLDYAHRQIIVDFVENFRTAYNRKDLKMLRSVFGEKALIITGRVVSEKPNTDISKIKLNNDRVVYTKQTKAEYLANLERVFKITKYINVTFKDIDVVRHPKYDDIYGVTLKQFWHTNRYSDEGYLFLLIDFRDKDHPQIQVRTWQPYKDKQGNIVTDEEQVFHLGSFRITR
ncbi:MAG: nuclear transport factor 2 family protein [Prevotella sp.]|nr:nuclear transport factor 2 family protein [Prevotella sp.]MBQ6210356.1 nuclear transport factor 2 family protein [Prevotella sp.]